MKLFAMFVAAVAAGFALLTARTLREFALATSVWLLVLAHVPF